jgi:hypothetical protein
MAGHLHQPISNVARYDDPESDRLITWVEARGEENVSADLRERYRITVEGRRRREAHEAERTTLEAAAPAPAATRRLWADDIIFKRRDVPDDEETWLTAAHEWTGGQSLGVAFVALVALAQESAGEVGDLKARLRELRDETHAKIDAQFKGFEQAVAELRGEDRRAIFERIGETLVEAENRIDHSFARALEAERERSEIELALVRDEIMTVVSEKTYGQITDDGPKLELAEKAIAAIRRSLAKLEKAGVERHDALAAEFAARLAALESEHKKATRSLLVRTGASLVLAKKEAQRAEALETKVAALEETMARLLDTLLANKIIS